MTRIIVLALAAGAALALEVDRNSAQAAAWCLIGGNSGRSCGYYTFEQCLASRAGGSTQCVPNTSEPSSQSDGGRSSRSRR